MIRRHLAKLLATAAIAVCAFAGQGERPAHAATMYLCSPHIAGAVSGPRVITNPNVTPNTNTSLNGLGCGYFTATDGAYALTQGFVPAQSGGQVSISGLGSGTGATATSTSMSLPPNAYITAIAVQNFGTTSPSIKIGSESCTSASPPIGGCGGGVVAAISAVTAAITWAVDPGPTGGVNANVLTATNPSGAWQINRRSFGTGGAQSLFVDQISSSSLSTASVSVTVFYNIL